MQQAADTHRTYRSDAGLSMADFSEFRSRAADSHPPVRLVPGPRWFSEDHPVSRLHSDASAFIGELAGILLRSLHPASAAVLTDFGHAEKPWAAVRSTAELHHVIVSGPVDDGVVVISQQMDAHSAATGYDETGSYYWGSDRSLLEWTHQSRLWAMLGANRGHAQRPLLPFDSESAVQGWAPIARLSGVPRPATSLVELNSYMRGKVSGLRPTAVSRAYAEALLHEKDTGLLRVSHAAFAVLPASVRRLFGAECMSSASLSRFEMPATSAHSDLDPHAWDVPCPIAAPSALQITRHFA